MKKWLSSWLFSVGCSVLFLVSCSKDKDSAIAPELIVSTEKLTFSNAGETKTFHVKSNTAWSLSSSESWLSFSVNKGESGTTKVELTVAENANITDRNAAVMVTAADLTKRIDVLQSAAVLFTVEKNDYILDKNAQEIELKIETNQPYTVELSADWVARKGNPVVSGNKHTETFTIKRNGNIFDRAAIITLKKGNESLVVNVNQAKNPLNIAANTEGVAAAAVALSQKMKVGWNLGNALEAVASSTSANETLWGNPKTTKALIDAVKAAGFNAVRIPCAWSGYIEDQTTYKIKDSWLERVKEVVDYCVSNDMYAIINIHWDGGWLEEKPLYSEQEAVNKKQKALWEQIAVYFRDYDEHLLFAGTNEVHADYGTPTLEHITVQMSYNQTFVNAVRSTGGRNAYRNLVVQAYNTNIQQAVNYLVMPTDNVSKRLMAEVHFYDPYEFALDHSSNKYLWGSEFAGSANVANWGQEAWVDSQFESVKTKFINNEIPVILGEYAATLRLSLPAAELEKHKKSRVNYLGYVNASAKRNGLIPFYWDSGHTGDNGSGLFDRNKAIPFYQDAIDAIVAPFK